MFVSSAKNGHTDQDIVWMADTGVLDGDPDLSTKRSNLGGNWAPSKALDVCCCVHSKRDHSMVNNIMTAGLWQPTAMLLTGRGHVTLSLVKIYPPPPWCGLLSKYFDHMLSSLLQLVLHYVLYAVWTSYKTWMRHPSTLADGKDSEAWRELLDNTGPPSPFDLLSHHAWNVHTPMYTDITEHKEHNKCTFVCTNSCICTHFRVVAAIVYFLVFNNTILCYELLHLTCNVLSPFLSFFHNNTNLALLIYFLCHLEPLWNILFCVGCDVKP